MEKKLTELQTKMLTMIKWFHQYCVENNIAYYMVGGTMLGAVRHKGFIPWDDDIDVGIPRKDYNRLLEVSKNLDKKVCPYVIESHHNGNEDFEYPYAKVYDTTTTLIENKRKRPKRGIFIDVFPLDGIGTTTDDAFRNFRPIGRKLDLLAARSCALRSGRNRLKNLIVFCVGLLPAFMLNSRRLLTVIDRLCEKRDFDDFPYVGNLVGNWRTKEIMPRTAFGRPVLYQFEDTKLYGPEKFDDYLTYLYKDWRKFPPPEKQKSQHDFIDIDLYRSYLE